MSAPEHVTVHFASPYWHAPAGRRAVVIRSYWRNGEGWFRLRDIDTGEDFDSPDVFWTDPEEGS